jgi:N-acetyltransferase 10
LNFWSRKVFKVCYVRQTTNDLTGEHSSIMLRELSPSSSGLRADPDSPTPGWLEAYVSDYRRRLVSLMNFSFSSMEAALAITLIDPDRELTSSKPEGALAGNDDDDDDDGEKAKGTKSTAKTPSKEVVNTDTLLRVGSGQAIYSQLTARELTSVHLSHHDLKRLELYARNMVDHHMILDMLPSLSRLLFLGRLRGVKLSYLQVAILLATGLQHRYRGID